MDKYEQEFKEKYPLPKELEDYLIATGWIVDDKPTQAVKLNWPFHFMIHAGSDQTRCGGRVSDGYRYMYEIAISRDRLVFLEHRFGGFTGNQYYFDQLFIGTVTNVKDFQDLLRLLDAENNLGVKGK